MTDRQAQILAAFRQFEREHRKWLNTSEVAALLNLSVPSVKRRAADGWLPARRVGRNWRYPVKQIAEHLKQREHIRQNYKPACDLDRLLRGGPEPASTIARDTPAAWAESGRVRVVEGYFWGLGVARLYHLADAKRAHLEDFASKYPRTCRRCLILSDYLDAELFCPLCQYRHNTGREWVYRGPTWRICSPVIDEAWIR